MYEKSCRCGASKKRFKMDIGPFFVSDCCSKDYDELGRPKLMEGEKVTEADGPAGNLMDKLMDALRLPKNDDSPQTVPAPASAPTSAPAAPSSALPPRPGKNKMRDMRVEELKAVGKARGIEGAESMTKNQLIDAISKS